MMIVIECTALKTILVCPKIETQLQGDCQIKSNKSGVCAWQIRDSVQMMILLLFVSSGAVLVVVVLDEYLICFCFISFAGVSRIIIIIVVSAVEFW